MEGADSKPCQADRGWFGVVQTKNGHTNEPGWRQISSWRLRQDAKEEHFCRTCVPETRYHCPLGTKKTISSQALRENFSVLLEGQNGRLFGAGAISAQYPGIYRPRRDRRTGGGYAQGGHGRSVRSGPAPVAFCGGAQAQAIGQTGQGPRTC